MDWLSSHNTAGTTLPPHGIAPLSSWHSRSLEELALGSLGGHPGSSYGVVGEAVTSRRFHGRS
jgi:hypothetical protein